VQLIRQYVANAEEDKEDTMNRGRLKLLSGRQHGYMDYAYGIITLLAPMLFGIGESAALLCYIMGASVLVLSLLTRYPLGAIKAVPFTAHGWIELAAAFIMLASIPLLGFEGAGYNFFMTMSILVMALWFVTDYVGTDVAYEGVEGRTGARERAGVR
jgi:hypothetical protein